MAKRAHIVTMDEARMAAQAVRKHPAAPQTPAKQKPKKGLLGIGAPAASAKGVRKLGQSPKAQRPASGPIAAPDAPTRAIGAPARPVSAPVAGAGRRPASAPFGARPAVAPPREVLRFDEREEAAAERARAEAAPAPARPRRGVARKLTERFSGRRQAAAKGRASRQFEQRYGGQGAPAGDAAGPRAAVYQGQMGSSHRRAAQSLASGALGAATAVASSASGRSRKGRSGGISLKALVPAVVAGCLVLTCLFMYGPVQLWYQEMRESDRLQLEYAALQDRNELLQQDLDSLSSEGGVEDRVHQQYGWVRDGEHAVSVSGISDTGDIDFVGNVAPGSVQAPETWYSFILDPLFGVS